MLEGELKGHLVYFLFYFLLTEISHVKEHCVTHYKCDGYLYSLDLKHNIVNSAGFVILANVKKYSVDPIRRTKVTFADVNTKLVGL